MFKRFVAIVTIVVVLLFSLSLGVQAQGPYLPTALCAGCYLPTSVGSDYVPTRGPSIPPTWTPLPPGPTSTPQGQYRALVQSYAILYRIVAGHLELFVPITLLHPGEVITVSPYDPYRVWILSGWASGLIIEKWTIVRYP